MCESGIFSGGYLEKVQDTEIDLGITGKDRDLNAKTASPSPTSGRRTEEALDGQIASGLGGCELDYGEENGKEVEGVSGTHSPAAVNDEDGRIPENGGRRWRTSAVARAPSRDGAPGVVRRRGAEL